MRTLHLSFALAFLAVYASATNAPAHWRKALEARKVRADRTVQPVNPLQRLARRQNTASPLPCASQVEDPERADNCCPSAQTYTISGSEQQACCPSSRVVSDNSCCLPNEQSDSAGQCCGFTSTGQSIDTYCHTGGCCTSDAPNSDGQACCSNAEYIEASSTCCSAGSTAAMDGSCCQGTLNTNSAGNQKCCSTGQEYHETSAGTQICCASGDYDPVQQVCGDGQVGSVCSTTNPCKTNGLTCEDDGTGANQMRCFTSDGVTCGTEEECSPVSTCAAQFDSNGSYSGSSCTADSDAPALNTLRGRCDPNAATTCASTSQQPATCVPNDGAPDYCQNTAGATCGDNSDCYQSSCQAGTCSASARRKIKRRSLDEKPVQFSKRGERRHLLRRDQALDMIANHGVFYYEDVLIHDPTFMPKRSRWSEHFNAAVKTLAPWHPEVMAERALKLFQHPSGQIALSKNFKGQSSDAIWVIRELIDSPSFENFDYGWITINKDGLARLADKLESRQNATMAAELQRRVTSEL